LRIKEQETCLTLQEHDDDDDDDDKRYSSITFSSKHVVGVDAPGVMILIGIFPINKL
jgi:hypothetical protein